MFRLSRPLVFGATAAVALLTSSALLLASQYQTPEPDLSILNYKLSTPAYVSLIDGSSRHVLLKQLGVPEKTAPGVKLVVLPSVLIGPPGQVAPAGPKLPEEVVKARTEAVRQKTTQVASRGENPVPRVDSGIVSYALSLQGIPYRFGGTTPAGFDCSGFTQYVFAKFGINLPRTSYDQIQVGSAVPKADLKAGDLVFFTTYTAGASHVGIYIGNSQFVHASTSGTRTGSLTTSYYINRYVGARRVSR